MVTRHTQTFDDHPDIPGRVRFVVRFGLMPEPDDNQPLALFGMAAIDRLVPDPAEHKKLFTAEGVVRTFDSVDDALAFIALIQQTVKDTMEYWKRAASFAGRNP